MDILKAIAKGGGPKHAILALGYAGWGPGQLETEIQSNGWLHCAADADLIFGRDVEEKYLRALHKIGIDPACCPTKPATPDTSSCQLRQVGHRPFQPAAARSSGQASIAVPGTTPSIVSHADREASIARP